MIVWRLTDGRRGHENQTLGLVEALARRRSLAVHELAVPGRAAALGQWLAGRFPAGDGLPDPDLILAAGHRSHLSLLAARRVRGGRAVVLMKPTLPLGWFDLCLIPEHDAPPARDNVIATRGTLNRMRPGEKSADEALVLLGGPSKGVRWEDERVAWQVAELVAARPEMRWTVADSRRTPEGFLGLLAGIAAERVGHAAVDGDWLPARLASAPEVWVTGDSVNMVYEALTAGCAVGVLGLALARRRAGRVSRGLDRLLERGTVTAFDGAHAGRRPAPPVGPFNEAERCADWIVDNWFAEVDG